MTGSLDESHYDVVKARYESDQQLLSHFSDDGGATTIAVVSEPNDLETYCDEWMPALGMPERHLKRYHQYLSGFLTNSAVDNPRERAYDEARLDYHYGRHLRTSDEAQAALSELVCRLNNGEDITLVCFEKPHEPCHRHKLKEVIEARLDSQFDFSEKKLEVV